MWIDLCILAKSGWSDLKSSDNYPNINSNIFRWLSFPEPHELFLYMVFFFKLNLRLGIATFRKHSDGGSLTNIVTFCNMLFEKIRNNNIDFD